MNKNKKNNKDKINKLKKKNKYKNKIISFNFKLKKTKF